MDLVEGSLASFPEDSRGATHSGEPSAGTNIPLRKSASKLRPTARFAATGEFYRELEISC